MSTASYRGPLLVIFCLLAANADAETNQANRHVSWLPSIQNLLFSCSTYSGSATANLFNIGDSIGVGEAADDTVFAPNPALVWSTGYDISDQVESVNENLEALDIAFYENNETRNGIFNQAVSGAKMVDFAPQAQQVVSAAVATQSCTAGSVTVLLGNNDVCASDMGSMTDISAFESQFRAGLDILSSSRATKEAHVQVSGIPALYWLWESKRNQLGCPFIWLFVPCENLLDSPADDCASEASRLDPDSFYAGDGPACTRRKQFHARIRDEYNPVLKTVLEEYRDDGRLPNAAYVNVFDVRFERSHINNGDCFHPSEAGHTLLARKQWCRSAWGESDPGCAGE